MASYDGRTGSRARGLGTFAGVFTPSILTILGIILFRRMGYVVGSAGLGRALLIVAIANDISVLTSISLSAIATNIRVKGGGDYFIISRTLGVEFGGAIGLVLFLAQSVSIAFYSIGFAEVLVGLVPWTAPWLGPLIAALVIGVLFVFAWLGADWATRFQFVIMAVLFGALAAFFVGGISAWDAGLLRANWKPAPNAAPFWAVFAVFFPAVTGFTQGVSMSGDLRDAGRSLPRGTFAAVGLSLVVYVAAAVVFAGALPLHELASDYGAMGRIATWEWIILAGVFAATLSSAMASFLGAPRILQALAADRIFPVLDPFAKGHGRARNPRRGVLLSAVIALVTVACGNLNAVASVVAMFFLLSYGLLNYATFYEAKAASPSFRPRFRWFDQRLSLLGAAGCLGAMLAIQPAAALVSASILLAVYQYIKRTAGPARWADSSRSYMFQRVREHLFALAEGPEHPRDWRPQILALAGDDPHREPLLSFASWIEGESGLTSAVTILEKDNGNLRERRLEQAGRLAEQIRDLGLECFPLVIAADDLRSGFEILLQAYGVGPLKANIVLLNWLEQTAAEPGEERAYGRQLREAIRLGRNLVVLQAAERDWSRLEEIPAGRRRIDVWWWGGDSSRLCLLLAYLMTRTPAWRDARIRVVTEGDYGKGEALRRLEATLQEIRIEADSQVLDPVTAEVVVQQSSDAAVVFLPLWLRGSRMRDAFEQDPRHLVERLPMTALCLAAEDIELAAEADEGEAASEAARRDAAEAAERVADKLEKESAIRIKAEVELSRALANETDPGRRRELDAELDAAVAEAQDATGKARRARRRANRAMDAVVRQQDQGAE